MSAPTAELARLAALADYRIVGAPVEQDLIAIAELAVQVCGASSAAVNLLDDKFQHQVATFGIHPLVCAREDSMCATTLEEGCDLVVEDARLDPRFADNPFVTGRLGNIVFYAASMLITPDHHVIGTLCVFHTEPHTMSSDQYRALSVLAHHVVDVLELRRNARVLGETIAELTRSQSQLAAFAGQVSHDLKTPLTATLGFTELLQENSAVLSDASAMRYVERCVASSRRMMTLINELLAYASVGGSLNRSDVPLTEVMARVLDDLGDVPDDAEVTTDDGTVYADPVQLRVLLQNLVGNSLNYRRPDVAPVVHVRLAEVTGGTEMCVVDNGRGIPADRRLEVFSPLVRLATDKPGTGLGLETCDRVVTAHGGAISVEDTAGGGTTMCVFLPSAN